LKKTRRFASPAGRHLNPARPAAVVFRAGAVWSAIAACERALLKRDKKARAYGQTRA